MHSCKRLGFIVIVLVSSVVVFNAVVFSETENSFSDVSSSHVNSDAVFYVKDQGIVKGYNDGSYKPDKSINRAEFTKIIVESVFEDDEIKGTACFSDVKDEWFANYVCTAFSNGIISGYPDKTFKPEQEIAFVEAAKIIVIAFDYQYEDKGVWYQPFVATLSEKMAIPVSVVDLNKKITRGEMAEMIYRLKKDVQNKTAMNYDLDADRLSEVQSEEEMTEEVESEADTQQVEDAIVAEVVDEIASIGGQVHEQAGCEGGQVFVPKNGFLDGCEYKCRAGYMKKEGRCDRIFVPENAFLDDYDFLCEQGYKREVNECVEILVPENSFLEGYSFKCIRGFVHDGDKCVQAFCDDALYQPPVNAEKFFCDFSCKSGYCKIGNECVAIKLPVMGEAYQCDFTCPQGWCKEDGQCNKVHNPANSKVKGCDFECNAGYCRKDGQCVRVKIPANGIADGCAFKCGAGYVKVGEECVKNEG